ncbi:MAG TPA: acyl-CoA dehydrogenase family protein [Dehalococcoidia bacterium]|jgi:alkylation response protein AidB-like acyl-CoA dehydrogenase
MTYLELNKCLTFDESSIKEQIHRFGVEVMRPAAMELDPLPPEEVIAPGSVFWDVFRKAYQLGLHSAGLPESVGGVEMSPLARHIFCEEMGWASADFAIGLGVSPFPYSFGAMTGNQTVLEDVVRPFVEDQEARFIGCWAITEPAHGSDSLLISHEQFWKPETAFDLFAKQDGDAWLISGQKSAWVSNGTIATHALAFLGVDRSRGSAGSCVALIPLDLAGVSRGPPVNKLGQRALNQGEIFFDDVRIPREYVLVPTEGYPYVIDSVLAGANASMGAIFTGVARAALEEALSYTRNRIQGGRPVCEHQAVQLKLMDMFIKVEAARALSRSVMVYNTQTSPPATQYSIASKVFCTEAAFMVASDAVQLHGGYGLVKGTVAEKLFRDSRAAMIEDGTNEVLSLAGAKRVVEQYQP